MKNKTLLLLLGVLDAVCIFGHCCGPWVNLVMVTEIITMV